MWHNRPYSTGPWACQEGTVLGPAALASSGRGSWGMAAAWRRSRWGTAPAVVGTDCSARTADPRNSPGRRKLQEKVLHMCFRCSLIQRAPFSSFYG